MTKLKLIIHQQMHYLLNFDCLNYTHNSHELRSYMFRSSTIIREPVLTKLYC
jgi:hypothetical protein